MSEEDPISLIVSFRNIPDPRVEGRCDHQLIDLKQVLKPAYSDYRHVLP